MFTWSLNHLIGLFPANKISSTYPRCTHEAPTMKKDNDTAERTVVRRSPVLKCITSKRASEGAERKMTSSLRSRTSAARALASSHPVRNPSARHIDSVHLGTAPRSSCDLLIQGTVWLIENE